MAQSNKSKSAAKKTTAAKKGKSGSSKNGRSGAKSKQAQATGEREAVRVRRECGGALGLGRPCGLAPSLTEAATMATMAPDVGE